VSRRPLASSPSRALTRLTPIPRPTHEPVSEAEDKIIIELIVRLLRQARQYGIFFLWAAQDLLNKIRNYSGTLEFAVLLMEGIG